MRGGEEERKGGREGGREEERERERERERDRKKKNVRVVTIVNGDEANHPRANYTLTNANECAIKRD